MTASPTNSSEHLEQSAKAVWAAPTIEEIDYTATEASVGTYGGQDGGLYAS